MLNGAKRWIGNGAFADLVVIWARDIADNQVKGFLVAYTRRPGFAATKIERKQSLRAVENADIVLATWWSPSADRLQNIHGFRDVAVVLRLTRAGVAWQALGVAVGAYEAAVGVREGADQFGKPIASFQLVQQKLANCLGNITACIAMCVRVSQLQDEDIQSDQHSAMAKAYVDRSDAGDRRAVPGDRRRQRHPARPRRRPVLRRRGGGVLVRGNLRHEQPDRGPGHHRHRGVRLRYESNGWRRRATGAGFTARAGRGGSATEPLGTAITLGPDLSRPCEAPTCLADSPRRPSANWRRCACRAASAEKNLMYQEAISSIISSSWWTAVKITGDVGGRTTMITGRQIYGRPSVGEGHPGGDLMGLAHPNRESSTLSQLHPFVMHPMTECFSWVRELLRTPHPNLP